MRSKDGVVSPMSLQSPGSPNAVYGGDLESATPIAEHHRMPDSPASPKPRKESKSIFSNLGATKSSTRIAANDNAIRQVPEQEARKTFYTNGRNGTSTPDLGRPVQTPTSEGRESANNISEGLLRDADYQSDIVSSEQRSNSSSGNSSRPAEDCVDVQDSKHNASKPKTKGVLTRSKSIKIEDNLGTRAMLKANPPKVSPEAMGSSWGNSGDGLKIAPLEKGQSWRSNISFGKLRTQSADRHEGPQHPNRDDDTSSRKDRTEQSSLASGSYNESKGATLMSSLGSGARKMGGKMETARKGIFGKLGRSSSNHERELQIPKEPYQFKVIHMPLVEQTRLTRISSRLESSRDKTEFWMPALPWRCIE
jgi:hypothetical protein